MFLEFLAYHFIKQNLVCYPFEKYCTKARASMFLLEFEFSNKDLQVGTFSSCLFQILHELHFSK